MSFIKKSSAKLGSIVYMVSQIASMGFAFLINVLIANYSGSDVAYGQYKYVTNFILTLWILKE